MWRKLMGMLFPLASYYRLTPNPTPRKYFLRSYDYLGYLLLYPLLWPFKKRELIKNPKKILVVMLDALGDLLLSTPAIHALRAAYPKIRIDVVVDPAFDVFENHPMIDNCYYYRAAWLHSFIDRLKWIVQNHKTARALRKIKYDLVIDLRAEYYTLKSSFFFNGKQLVSQTIRNGGFFLDVKAPDNGLQHEAERKLSIIEYISNQKASHYPIEYYYPKKITAKKFKNLRTLYKLGKYIVVHPFSTWEQRAWPIEEFAKFINWVIKKYGYKCVIIGSANEAPKASVLERMVHNKNLINLIGQASLPMTAEIIRNAEVFIGNDSGPLHLASAVQNNIIALFGPNIPLRYGPWQRSNSKVLHHQLPCCPCPQTTCKVNTVLHEAYHSTGDSNYVRSDR